MNNKLQPALIGGVVLGLLSAIPFVNILNVCCCAWAIIGGALAAFMYVKSSPTQVRIGEGAGLGAISGVIGSFINWIVGIPLSFLVSNTVYGILVKIMASVDPRQAEEMRRQFEQAQNLPFTAQIPSILLGAVISLALLTIFSTLGGIIGVAIFEKRKDGDVPPAPPAFGGQPGGGGYAG